MRWNSEVTARRALPGRLRHLVQRAGGRVVVVYEAVNREVLGSERVRLDALHATQHALRHSSIELLARRCMAAMIEFKQTPIRWISCKA